MGTAPHITVSTSWDEPGFNELGQKLIAHNGPLYGAMDIQPLLLEIRDDAGKLRAGLSGKIFYQWLTIELLWVAENLRGKGTGTAMMKKAETEALARGCTHAWVDTIGTEALQFYARNGYAVWGELPDYPRGHRRTFLKKTLMA